MSELIPAMGEKAAQKLITQAQRAGAVATARKLWKFFPPAVAGVGGSEHSYNMVEKLVIADSPKAIADIARKRQQAESVLR
jgi:hypothetical protein